MNINRRKGFMALSLAAVMAVGGTGAALADEPGVVPGDTYTEAMARLQDSHMEYDELTDLIKNCYTPIKSAYSMIDTMEEDQGSIATAMQWWLMIICPRQTSWQMFWAAVILRSCRWWEEPGCCVPAQGPWIVPLSAASPAGVWTAR